MTRLNPNLVAAATVADGTLTTIGATIALTAKVMWYTFFMIVATLTAFVGNEHHNVFGVYALCLGFAYVVPRAFMLFARLVAMFG